MSHDPVGQITLTLQDVKAGQPGAQDRLFSLVYDQLRLLAKKRVSFEGYGAPEPTTLVHEAYLRLFKQDQKPASWEDRHHFFWASARAMRDILVERARRDGAWKRGGHRKRIELREDMATVSDGADLLELHDALTKLEAIHPRPAQVVSLQFFAGLNRDQIAELLQISPSAAWREWAFARAWLLNQLEGPPGNTPAG